MYLNKKEKLILQQKKIIKKQQEIITELEEEIECLQEQVTNYENMSMTIELTKNMYLKYKQLVQDLQNCKSEYSILNREIMKFLK